MTHQVQRDCQSMEKAKELQCTIHALNVLPDHAHLLIECSKNIISKVIGQMKGYTARKINKAYRKDEYANKDHRYYDGTAIKLLARGYSKTLVLSEEQFVNTVNYIEFNKEKHEAKGANTYNTADSNDWVNPVVAWVKGGEGV